MEWRRNKVICAGADIGIHHAASRNSKQGIISDDLELRYVMVAGAAERLVIGSGGNRLRNLRL
jgi:hypothetical protein